MAEVTPSNARKVLQRWILANGLGVVCDLRRSHGSYLHDAVSGTDYLDFFSFFASRALCFNHPKLRDKAFLAHLGEMALHKPSNCDLYTVEYAQFVETFGRVALGDDFRHLFFIEGGGAAVGNAVKAAIDWKHRKNIASGHGAMGQQIIHFKQAFHGRTGYSLSLTDSYDPRKAMYYPKFSWPRITNPVLHAFDDASIEAVEKKEAQALSEIDAAFNEHGHDIAGIIIEPIQGEGGDNYFRTEFLRSLRQIANEREVLLMFDEVQTGFGGTGTWWDWQHHGVQPDIIIFGKKTQVCGFAATERLDEVDGVFKVSSRISSTFEGNLVDMVRCQRIIEIIEEDNLIDNAKTMGRYLRKVLRGLQESHECITDIRGRGTWAAFSMPTTHDRDRLLQACFDEELLLLPSGTHTIRFRPALDIGADAIGRAAAQLEAGIKRAFQ